MNKFACILKTKLDGTTKRRITMDSKQSMVTAASRKQYKASLPRATDLISDILALLAAAKPEEQVEAMVLDAEDAFWQVPLHPSERRFYCALPHRREGRSWRTTCLA